MTHTQETLQEIAHKYGFPTHINGHSGFKFTDGGLENFANEFRQTAIEEECAKLGVEPVAKVFAGHSGLRVESYDLPAGTHKLYTYAAILSAKREAFEQMISAAEKLTSKTSSGRALLATVVYHLRALADEQGEG